MALLYLGGAFVNPAFFGSTEALHALLRDTSRYGVMAVGMTFVIVNKDLDLSVGSTYGLVGVVFARLFAPSFLDLGVVPAVLALPAARRADRPDQRRAGHHPARCRPSSPR